MWADPAPAISIPAGITIGLVASSVQSLGLTIQRKSHVLNQEAPESERRVEHRRPLWLLGFAIFITSNILGSVFQIASLPVVILAPLGAVSLLWNALFARLILGDLFSKFMVLGTLLIVAGAVLIARFGIVPEPTHSLEDLLALFARDAFVIYFSLLGVVLALVLAATHIFEWSLYRRIALESGALSPCSSSTSRSTSPIPLTPSRISASIPSERTPLLSRRQSSTAPSVSSTTTAAGPPLQKYRAQLNVLAISYASMSGILSGMCLIFAKSGVELLMLSIVGGQNQFWRWESWALVGGLVVFALLQLWYLHKSLILADPTLVCPLAFCFYNISSIANGLVYYDQLSELTPFHLSLVVLGSAVLLGGVWTLSIQDAEEEGVIRLREGDWIPADEEGVGPAVVNPGDVVRGVESLVPATSNNDDQEGPRQQQEYFSTPHHHRTRSHQHTHHHHQTLPPLASPNIVTTLPRFGHLPPPTTSPTSPHQQHTIPPGLGLSIGLSAASPGFFAGTRRRSDVPNVGRRSISENFSRGVGDGSPTRRRASEPGHDDDEEEIQVLLSPEEEGQGKVLSAEPDEIEGVDGPRGGWVWRLVGGRPWRRRRTAKDQTHV